VDKTQTLVDKYRRGLITPREFLVGLVHLMPTNDGLFAARFIVDYKGDDTDLARFVLRVLRLDV
jgi:hypothetical protein